MGEEWWAPSSSFGGAPEGSARPGACAADPPRGVHKHSDLAAARRARSQLGTELTAATQTPSTT